ncbi:hypothetical protein [Xinfangfangia pollutisoli]|uniref:hypothetical protein n=1 Tax=Xinfangfangia pollutisoli TaxID=2865960 RepID=UPI001CD560D3|nr:hypothetical protein [Xinfangfangia pollutisoli]
MTPADLIAALHAPRLPEGFTALGWDDLLAAAGLGLVLAALVLALLGPILRPRPRRLRPAERIAATAALPPADRLLALARLLQDLGGQLPDDQRAALYAGLPGDPARIEALILQAGRR